MKTRIFNLIIIDESGSMQSIKKAAIDSVNETIQSINATAEKYKYQEHIVSLVTFHDDVKTVYECVPIKEVEWLTPETYQPKCCTALYDAMEMDQLRQSAPAEAKAIEAAKKVFSIEEATSALSIIRGAESEGSELAAMLQVIYYDETKDKTGQEECQIRIAEKYPFFNLMLGESYVMKYHECEDNSYIQKTIECYYKAYAHGMLNPKYANALLGMYVNFGEKGLVKSDEKEIERLKILAKRTY